MIGAVDAVRVSNGIPSRIASAALHVPEPTDFRPRYLPVSVSNSVCDEQQPGEYDLTVLAFDEGKSATRLAVLSLSLTNPCRLILLRDARLPRAKSLVAFVDGRRSGVVGIVRRGRDAKDVLLVSDFETTHVVQIGKLLTSRLGILHSSELRVIAARADASAHETVAHSALNVLLVGDGALIALRIVDPFGIGGGGELEERIASRRIGGVPTWFEAAMIETSPCPSGEGNSLIHAWTRDGNSVVIGIGTNAADGFVVEWSNVLASAGRHIAQPAQLGWGRLHFGSDLIDGEWIIAGVDALEGGPASIAVRAETGESRVLFESLMLMPPMQGGVRFVHGELQSTLVLAAADQTGGYLVRWASGFQHGDPVWQWRRFEPAVEPARQVIRLAW